MILPSLGGSFGCVASVAMWWDSLEGDVVFPECFFEFVGAFIINDVEFRCISSVRLELGVQTGPGVGQLAGSLASFEGFGKDYVAFLVI